MIKTVWERQQQTLIGLLRARNDRIVLGGDGRADSVGHSSKYGPYTSIELMWNCILDVKIVASSEAGSSYHMLLEKLKRSLRFLTNWLTIDVLVTDRHRQIAKWLHENKRHDYIVTLWDQVLSECRETCSTTKGAALVVSLPTLTLCRLYSPCKRGCY